MGLMSWLRGGRGGAARSGDAPAPAPVADRGDRVDVNRLEPLQRVVSGQRLTVGPGEFEASLTTRRDTVLGTPLGHLVSPEAPAGLVRGVGVAESAPSPSPSPPQSPVSAQRSVDVPSRGPVTRFGRADGPGAVPARGPASSGLVSAPVSVPVQRLYGGEGPAMTSAAGPESGPGGGEELPVRRLVGERPVVAEPAVLDSPPAPSPSPDSPSAPGSGLGVQRAATPPADERPRRAAGLGAPLPGLPPTAQRRAASAPDAHDSRVPPADPVVSGPSDVLGPEGADRPTAPLLGDDPLVGEVFPSRPDGPAADDAPAAVGGLGGARGMGGAGDARLAAGAGGTSGVGGIADARGPVQRSAGPLPLSDPSPRASAPAGSGPLAPLLGDRPLIPRNVDVQRAAEPRPQPAAGDAPHHAPEGVPVRWTGTAGLGPTAGPGVAVGPAPPSTAPAGAPSAHSAPLQRQSAGGPPVPASAAPSLPAPGSGPARGLPSAGAVAVAAGVAQRMADGSVVFRGAPASGTSRPVVQRDAEVSEPVEEPPPPGPDPDPVAEPEDGVEAEAGPVAGAGEAGAAPNDGTRSPGVTDELVRALYAPLSRLLKNDLRLERERAGHLINTRH
ncbi:hypothetical protein [Streptomyces sp. NPDC006267]|uniref:hypothetical protein n=1 Tax=Streptomyces sp. NPDC006267 TaxID=3157173 RepID=UPI0033BBAC01